MAISWDPLMSSLVKPENTNKALPVSSSPNTSIKHGSRHFTAYTKVTERSYLASLVLSLSSFPHSQSFPGSTAKCKGSNLCSESVRGITAEVEKKQGVGWGEQKQQKDDLAVKSSITGWRKRADFERTAELSHPEHHKWFILGSISLVWCLYNRRRRI